MFVYLLYSLSDLLIRLLIYANKTSQKQFIVRVVIAQTGGLF